MISKSKRKNITKKKITIIQGKMIKITGDMARHKIVKKVFNNFITMEYRKKGRGVTFQYPVENLPDGQLLISSPGHKKNFDFKVEVLGEFGLGKGTHDEIGLDIRNKKQENPQKFGALLQALTAIVDKKGG